MTIHTPKTFIDSYQHALEHDFDKDGQPATYAEGYPKEWGTEVSEYDLGKASNCLALTDDDSLLAVNIDHSIGVFEVTNAGELKLKYLLDGHKGHIRSLAFQPHAGKLLVSCSDVYGAEREQHVRIWDLSEHPAVDDQRPEGNNHGSEKPIEGTIAPFDSFPFTRDGNSIMYRDHPAEKALVVFDLPTRRIRFRLAGHTDRIMWAGDSPDGKYIATSAWDSTLRLWSASIGAQVHTLRGTGAQHWTGHFSPDSTRIAVGCGDHTVRVWDVATGQNVHVLDGFPDWVRGIQFNASDGRYLVASSSAVVRVYNTDADTTLVTYWQAKNPARSFAEIYPIQFSTRGDGTLFGFKFADGRLVLYDIEANVKWEMVRPAKRERVYGDGQFAFAKNSARIYSADSDGVIRTWNI